MAVSTSGSKSLKEYLKRYETNSNEEEKKKKKKRKKAKPDATGVLVVDEDPVWQKPVNLAEEEDDASADEEKPQVDEDIEVKRMRRLEQLRARRPYNAISEDGSGWVSLSPQRSNPNNLNSDLSPPRKQSARNDTPSPEPKVRRSDSGREDTDFSPPRQKRHHSPSPESGARAADSTGVNSDVSPPRRRRARNDSPSPEPRLKVSNSSGGDNDLSPPRQRQRQKRYHTPSPERDTKPSRSSGPNSWDIFSHQPRPQTSASHERKNSEILDSVDLSPPRRGNHSSSYQDHSHASQGSDLSPPRKSMKEVGRPGLAQRSRISHRRSIGNDTSVADLSPPRKSREESVVLASLKEQPKRGLISGRENREENLKTKNDEYLRFKDMDPSISGRGAEPVYRDKGVRISKEEHLKSRQKVEEKPKEVKLEWGKGIAQKREAEARLQELELEKDKPFARTRDDPDLDKMLKERVRWGDPMAHLVKKSHSELILADLGDNEKMKESGFIIPQDIPSHSWIKRGLDAAPNRYGIRPGRHWDGVDRSSGFEKQMFQKKNEKQATEREAYLWSVSDM